MCEITIVIPREFLKALATERAISDTELEVLSLAVNGKSSTAIATELDISPEAVRKRLTEVYKKFQILGAGTGKLAKLQQILVSLYQEHPSFSHLSYKKLDDRQEVSANPDQDWGEAPEPDVFYGRAEELAELEKLIVEDHCKLVAILGTGGIGKTTLVKKLTEKIRDKFEKDAIWYWLRRDLPVNKFLDEIIRCLNQEQKVVLAETTDRKISRLIEFLQSHRYLLVLDDVEVFSEGVAAGHYQKKYEEYGKLLQRLGEEPHKSCLILIGLEMPREIVLLETKRLARSKTLGTLKIEEASEILKSKGLSEDKDWQRLIEAYRGNPLALKLISTTIQELFGGSVTKFMNYDTLVSGDISDLLSKQFQRLSKLEKDIMYCLAIEQEPVTLSKLEQLFVITGAHPELLEAWESLRKRSLIELVSKSSSSFELRKVIMEYVTNNLVNEICDEIEIVDNEQDDKIKIDKIQLLKTHTLIKTQTQGDTKELQDHPIITRIINKLCNNYRSKILVESVLKKLQSLLQEQKVGYASENVCKLLDQLKKQSK